MYGTCVGASQVRTARPALWTSARGDPVDFQTAVDLLRVPGPRNPTSMPDEDTTRLYRRYHRLCPSCHLLLAPIRSPHWQEGRQLIRRKPRALWEGLDATLLPPFLLTFIAIINLRYDSSGRGVNGEGK